MGNNGIVRVPIGAKYRLFTISCANNTKWVFLCCQQGIGLMVDALNTYDFVTGIGQY